MDASEKTFLTYECNTLYRLVGPRRVVCNSDGTWSALPSCKGMNTTDPDSSHVHFCSAYSCFEDSVTMEMTPVFFFGVVPIYCTWWHLFLPFSFVTVINVTKTLCSCCAVDYCVLDTSRYPVLKVDGVKYIKYGAVIRVACKDEYLFSNYSLVRCDDGNLRLSRCKYSIRFASEMFMTHSTFLFPRDVSLTIISVIYFTKYVK